MIFWLIIGMVLGVVIVSGWHWVDNRIE